MLCLTRPSDPRWIDSALADLDGVLADHAHCEMKAATNALSLATRFPHAPRIVRALVGLAEEELAHYRAVLDEIERRAIPLGTPPVDPYAAELRRLAASLRPTGAASLVDRLLVAAIIEARSCERFRILADALGARAAGAGSAAAGKSSDAGRLAAFYEELFAAEARHFRTLVDLAIEAAGGAAAEAVRARLAVLAEAEGALIERLEARATVHG